MNLRRVSLLVIAMSGLAAMLFTYLHTSKEISTDRAAFVSERKLFTETTSSRIEVTINDIYTSLRTVARLPGIRSHNYNFNSPDASQQNPSTPEMLDPSVWSYDANTSLTIQEIYNSLTSSITISNIYVVPNSFDLHEEYSYKLGALVTSNDFHLENKSAVDQFGVEEHRALRSQLDWFKENFPSHSSITNLEYPLLSSPEIITSITSEYEQNRRGIIFAVPYFNTDGLFYGSIVCIVLSNDMSKLLYSGDYALLNSAYDYAQGSPIFGQWDKSSKMGSRFTPDKELIYSELRAIPSADHMGSWYLWAGHADELFWARTGVQAALNTRKFGYSIVVLVTFGTAIFSLLLLKSQHRLATLNMALEGIVIKRTADLLDSRNEAVDALHREKQVANELRMQQYALDQHAIVSVTDTNGLIIYANNKFCEISGYTREELVGQSHRMLKSDEHKTELYRELWQTIKRGEVYTGDIKNQCKDGSYYWARVSIVPFKNNEGKIVKYSAIRTDITKSKDLEKHLIENNLRLTKTLEREQVTAIKLGKAMIELERLATTDKLTNLPNRTIFIDRLEFALKRSQRHDNRFAVLYIDFDGFKLVNDSYGHDVGDSLLQKIADIFRQELRATDTVARFGGDEFLVLLDNLTEYSDARQKANKLLTAFSKIVVINGHQIITTASIGLVTSEHEYSTPEEVIRDADIAMYQAKSRGKSQIVEFDAQMHTIAKERLSLEIDLSYALERNQLRLVYQPLIDLHNDRLVGFEALLRWDHPTLGTLDPASFIHIAEDTGLIISIGSWVIKSASAQISAWNNEFFSDCAIRMSVNVSKRQLMSELFFDDLTNSVKEHNIHKGELLLAVTETTIIEDLEYVVPLLNRIQKCGIKLAIDDFGTGVSSLSALHKLPIDVLKIDQSFVRMLDQDPSLLTIVSSISNLAKHLGITTVAEGIETKEIASAMLSVGCIIGQGCLYAKPLSVENAESYILEKLQEQYSSKRAA